MYGDIRRGVLDFNVLRDEGEAYARSMAAAGVRVALRRHDRLIHGSADSTGMGHSNREAMLEACRALRMGIGAGTSRRWGITPSQSSLAAKLTPQCGQLLAEMIADTFDEDQVAVVTGDVAFAKYFASRPLNHLVYTGGANTGREVMRAAAANLVPVTLELGGRNATIVGRDKVIDPTTIAVIAGVKTLKRGQMCVTADHCLVPEESLSGFVDALVAHMRAAFGADNAAGTCGIVSDRHMAHLTELVEQASESGAQVLQIGQDPTDGSRLMPFFVVVDPSHDLPLMRQEVFGPILPIKTYRTTQDVIDRVNSGDHGV